jgi:hypothetical protein
MDGRKIQYLSEINTFRREQRIFKYAMANRSTKPQNQSGNNGTVVPRAELLNSCPGKAKAFVLYPGNL